MGKLRVLQVNKLYWPHIGGIESLVKQYSEGLSKFDDIDVRVLVCKDGRGKGSVEKIQGVNVTRANSFGTYFSCPLSFDFIRKFRLMAKDADVVEMHVPFPLSDAALLLSGYKGKVVVAWHSDVIKQKKLLLIYKPFMRYLLKRADKIIVATEGHITGSSYLPEYKDKCVVIPYGLKASDYPSEPSGFLSSRACSKEAVKVFFSGRLVYYKGVDVLLRAFKDVAGAELFISGDGVLETELKEFVRNSQMDEKVHFMGFLSDEDLKKAYSDCDIFVLPSVEKSEAFGIVQLEAMACGKPVINTALESGVPFVSLDGITGLTVPPKDPEALAEALDKLCSSPELRSRYGMAAMERAKSEFDEDIIISKLHELLVNLVKEQG